MKNKILIVMTFLAGTLLFNSCLKDKLNTDWTDSLKGKMYAQIVNNGLQSYTITNGSADQVIPIKVNIATDALPTSDITLTLGIDAAALSAYNAKNGTSFTLCPNTSVSSVVVKAGSRLATAQLTLKSANLLDVTVAYAVPISITAASGGVVIASNFKTEILQVPVANQWEGSYNMSYYILRSAPFDPVLSGNVRNIPWKLATSGAKSVTYWKTHLWADKSSVGGIGPWKLTIDDSVVPNLVTVTDAANASLKNRDGYVSRYVPSTKTFYIGVTWSTAGTREVTDTLVYTGKY